MKSDKIMYVTHQHKTRLKLEILNFELYTTPLERSFSSFQMMPKVFIDLEHTQSCKQKIYETFVCNMTSMWFLNKV